MSFRRCVSSLGLVALSCACGSEPDASGEPGASGISSAEGPEASFTVLEDRLLGARNVMMRFHITAEGAVQADLEGGFQARSDGSTKLTAAGSFAGEEVDLLLISDGQSFEYGPGSDRTRAPQPEHLQEALLLGFTRMGFLHNLARLVGKAPPDGVDGGVRDWAEVGSFQLESGEEGSRRVSFAMTIGGEPAGSATLEIGAEGYPVIRRQTVRFPSGEMRVVESYEAIAITP